MIINIFCDASIDTSSHIACGGCICNIQDSDNTSTKLVIQNNATNNSAEILAIWTGLQEALRYRSIYPNAIFRLFSDSKISLYGLRDWIKSWIQNMDDDGILVSSSGAPVANQQRFIECYNFIVENQLKIELYHQRGHVKERVNITDARTSFIRANKVAPEALGIDIEYLSNYNTAIDNSTRNALKRYIIEKYIDPSTTIIEGITPMMYQIRDGNLHQYIRNINKTTVKSRHDFKGGYNQ